MNKEGTIVVRTRGAMERIRESEFDPKIHTKVAETTAAREAAKAKEKS